VNESLLTPKGTITLRPAVPEDAAPLRALRLEGLERHPTAFGSDHVTAARDTAEKWAEDIARREVDGSGTICVAVSGGAAHGDQLVGMAGTWRENRPKTRHAGGIRSVYVRDGWRGLHIAEALIECCVAWAREQGIVILKLGVSANNTPAMRCYVRCGFRVYGVDPKVILHDGVYYDELLMAREV
jgi:RimJ/RimL family protein N-acetyltransferase